MTHEPPFGVLVVVHRCAHSSIEYLLLHRAHYAPEYDGDWAWGPPGGSRELGETIDACARRELLEETGLDLPICRVPHRDDDWAVYTAEASIDAAIELSGEHDRWVWVPADQALALASPKLIVDELESGVRALELER